LGYTLIHVRQVMQMISKNCMGTMILLKEGINACDLETDSCELIWIELLSNRVPPYLVFFITHHAVVTMLCNHSLSLKSLSSY